MNYYFPISVNRSKVSQFSFTKWSNTMNLYDELKIQIELPDILNLYRADTICPAPKMPIVDLGYFKDKKGKIEVIIQASVIQHEIALEDYYIYFTNQTKETIVKERLIDNDPDKADFLTVKRFQDGQNWVTRRTGFKIWMGKGAFVVTLNFACEESVYDSYADMFYYMMSSFSLLKLPDYDMAEQLRLFARKYPLDFATYVPFSWREGNQHFDTLIDMRSTFKKQYHGIVSGILSINSMKLEENKNISKKEILHKYLAAYEKQGLVIDKIQFSPIEKMLDFETVEKCDHKFSINQNGTLVVLNLKIFLVKIKEYWFYIDLIGIDKSQDYEAWAINKRAFLLAIKYLKIS